MDRAWQILRDGGLPLAMQASGQRRSETELAAAVREAIASEPAGRDAEALAAYVLAWHQHWPRAFAAALGADAGATVAWANEHAIDANRYLKLRRIALENLALVL
jgi:hypothetical protein